MKLFKRYSYLLIVLTIFSLSSGCEPIRRYLVEKMGATENYEVQGKDSGFQPQFIQKDSNKKQIKVHLSKIAEGLVQPTDVQAIPGEEILIILEKAGAIKALDLNTKKLTTVFTISNVKTDSEEGLLGITFHPSYPSMPKCYTNYVTEKNGKDTSRISEWSITKTEKGIQIDPKSERILMEVSQPYGNHDAGQLAFGPDGMLYFGWGDGGWRADPKGNGQNRKILLGSLLRIDVNKKDKGLEYAIPKDNPFVEDDCCRAEIFAYGIRNPWRFSFSPEGRIILADVGQDRYEEIDIVESGDNLGWNTKEGFHCFDPEEGCNSKGLIDPIYEYDREEGQSITGGYVYTNSKIGELQNKYVFGDFVSGRIWAFELPKDRAKVKNVHALGKWPILISTFGTDSHGNLYVADLGEGNLYRIDP